MPPLVKLVSSDQKEFAVAPKIAKMSKTVAALMEALNMEDADNEDAFEKNPIPLPNVSSEVLEKVMEWCEHHKEDPPMEEKKEDDTREKCTTDIPEWDKTFLKFEQTNQKPIFDLLVAANYLDIKGLMDNVSKILANVIKACKTAQEVRDRFRIHCDLTPEEEAEIRKKNSWCDDEPAAAAPAAVETVAAPAAADQLSDLLFMLDRYTCMKCGEEELTYRPSSPTSEGRGGTSMSRVTVVPRNTVAPPRSTIDN